MRRTPSRTDFEKMTPEEIIDQYGEEHFFLSWIKSQKTHSSSRNERRRARVAKKKAERAKKRR